MRVEPTPPFAREAKPLLKKFASLDGELKTLFAKLEVDATTGTSIGQGFYKIRLKIASKGGGKSGGARVITCIVAVQETVYLLSIYDKAEQETISDRRLSELLKLLPIA